MLNQVVLIGRLQKIVKDDNNNLMLTLKIQNDLNSDLFDVMISENFAKNISEFCEENDLIGVKGKLEYHDDKIIVHTDKISVLSQLKKNNEIER